MPSWGMHLLVAKKINEKLNLEDYNSFLIGNLIPDINNGKLIKDVSKVYSHRETHFGGNNPFIKNGKVCYYDVDKFIENNNKNFNNPIVLGYYIHLLTDLYFNNLTYTVHAILDKENNVIGLKSLDGKELIGDAEIRRKNKVEDFCIFVNDYIYKNDLIDRPYYDEKSLKFVQELTNIEVTKDDLQKMIEYIQMTKYGLVLERKEYLIFSEEELKVEIEKCVQKILKDLEDIRNKSIK